MGWRGILRDIQAASRQAERDAHRRQRALEKQQTLDARMQDFEQVRYEVELYENRMELLTSVHKECGSEWDWHAIQTAPCPSVPAREDVYEQGARRALERYRPSIWDRLFRKTQAKRESLQKAVEESRLRDKRDYHQALKDYQGSKADWENSRQFAARILKGDVSAYTEAIRETSPFGDLTILGSSIRFTVPNRTVVQVELDINGEKAIPSEIHSQLKNGKLSVKPMPKTRFYEIYQAYVCGCVLRVARELFALLPVKIVIVTALGEILNTQTGYLEQKPVLSVLIPRDTLSRIQWESVDPSDSMANFVHRMCFKKSKGLFAVEPVRLEELRV